MEEELTFGFDLETTGVKIATAGIVQICLIADTGGLRRPLLNTLVKPANPIPKEASDIHRIFDKDVENKPDQVFVAWLTQLLCDTMAPKYLVGFNSKHYDEPVLNRCLGARVFNGVVHLDVLDIVYRFYPELEQHKLGFLYQHFFGRPLEGAHDASADVLATLDILEAVLVDLEKTKAQMAEEMAVPKPYDIFPISKKYKGWRSSQVPKSMARWLLETSAKEDNPLRPDLLATVEMILKQ